MRLVRRCRRWRLHGRRSPLQRGDPSRAVSGAAEQVADRLVSMVQPFADASFAAHREAGRPIVLATTTPYDLVKPFADKLGLDDVIATRYGVDANGNYDGTLVGPFVWSAGKLEAITAWAAERDIDLADSYAYSDSVYDTPMLDAVGFPTVGQPGSANGVHGGSAPVADAQSRRVARCREISCRRHGSAAAGVAVCPTLGVPLRALRHLRHREHPDRGPRHSLRQPPQLFRRLSDVDRNRQERAHCSFPRKEGGVRRSDRRTDRCCNGVAFVSTVAQVLANQ